MNKLNYAHFCDIANVTENNKVNIIGLFKKIYADTLPAVHPSMSLVFEMHLDKGVFDILVKDEAGQIISEDRQKKIEREEGQDVGQIVKFQNVIFSEYKVKKFTISVNGSNLGSAEIEVIKQENA